MLLNRNTVEKHMWWKPKGGTSTIWFDNWSNLGPLHQHQSEILACHPLRDIGEFLSEEGLKFEEMKSYMTEYVINYVKSNLSIVQFIPQGDKP